MPSSLNFPRGEENVVMYEEGLRVGYRALEEGGLDPLFVFGEGTSYAEFEYSNFAVETIPGPELGANVFIDVKNVSERVAKEVVQVYVEGVLKGFKKINLSFK